MTKVLVVEDNDDNMELISFILGANGYQVIKARTGEAGVTLALEQRPDFIILDIQLPDIDGYEVLRRIRQSKANGDIPIIAMTSYAMSGDREAMLKAGCNGYIEKPIEPELVISQIAKLIGKKG